MNKLIFRKLSYDILVFFLLSSTAITLIIWVIQAVNLLDIISEQGHGIKVYILFSILNIPKIFSKLILFTFFLTLFVVLSRYQENNEILIFWTNGIRKISFINFIGKVSILFVIFQLLLNMYIVPYTQNLGQNFLKNSSIDFFPKLIQEKKFFNVMRNITIFVEDYKQDGTLNGIYIKEKINETDKKIIIANKGKILKDKFGYSFKLSDGKITNIDVNGTYNLGFNETIYDLSNIDSKVRKASKLGELKSSFLINCLEKNINKRKNKNLRCGDENTFLIKDIYEEIFKRAIIPLYLITISLISSLIIIKPKSNFKQKYYKVILFIAGFTIILFSQLSHKFISYNSIIELTFLLLPLILILSFYLLMFFKSNFKLNYL